jgi:hypothetical protein
MHVYAYTITHTLAYILCIVAKCPGMAGTVAEFGPMSRLCPGLPGFAALSRNPARLQVWHEQKLSILSTFVPYISIFSGCGSSRSRQSGRGLPKVGVVRIIYSVPGSLLINLATMIMSSFMHIIVIHFSSGIYFQIVRRALTRLFRNKGRL